MKYLLGAAILMVAVTFERPVSNAANLTGDLYVGFAEADITPKLGDKPVYVAGFGQNRKAVKVHDPLMARAIVLKHGDKKIAMVCMDIVGFFNHNVLKVREQLPGFSYVLVSSTHNHEGPDTLGLWGPSPFTSGIDPAYMQFVEKQAVKAVREADAALKLMTAKIGSAKGPELLDDSREPYIKHDELVALQFFSDDPKKTAGIVVQWNCHPETLAGQNKEISSDYVGYTVNYLKEKYRCPVVYLTGTVGGLMTSLHVDIKNEKGESLRDGTFEKTERYGHLLGKLTDKAIADAKPARLTPFEARRRDVYVPMDNRLYEAGRRIGVLDRPGFVWTGDMYNPGAPLTKESKERGSMKTEVGWLKLGELEIAAIPGEIYPELVLDKVQDPPDPGADFPDAPIEPAIYKQMRCPYRMIVGLANDEIGYIIPKRQWDVKKPFCYGRTKPQYGEENSVGPETAPIICKAFKELVDGKK